MGLTDQQTDFLANRKKLTQAWRVVGPLLLIVVACLGIWLFWHHPLLINPLEVAAKLKSGAIPDSTLFLMVVFLPCAVLTSLSLVVVMIILAYAAFSNEKKLIAMIQKLLDNGSDDQKRRP